MTERQLTAADAMSYNDIKVVQDRLDSIGPNTEFDQRFADTFPEFFTEQGRRITAQYISSPSETDGGEA